MSEYKVFCAKLKQELPGLPEPPFDNELGKKIYENVSQQAWGQWMEHCKMLLNEYRLNPARKQDQEVIVKQMEQFFFGGRFRASCRIRSLRRTEHTGPHSTKSSGGANDLPIFSQVKGRLLRGYLRPASAFPIHHLVTLPADNRSRGAAGIRHADPLGSAPRRGHEPRSARPCASFRTLTIAASFCLATSSPDLNFGRLKKEHWKFLGFIRKLSNPSARLKLCGSKATTIAASRKSCRIWSVSRCTRNINGNIGDLRHIAVHGHQFDGFRGQQRPRQLLDWHAALPATAKVGFEKIKTLTRFLDRLNTRWLRLSSKVAGWRARSCPSSSSGAHFLRTHSCRHARA